MVAGGLAGTAIQNQTGKTNGMEVEIRLIMARLSPSYDLNFQIGSRVRLVDAGGRTTVSLVSNVNSGYAAPVVQQGYAPVQ